VVLPATAWADDLQASVIESFNHEIEACWLRISVYVTADFGNVTDSARLGVALFRL
jgi:hypothetical protein